MSYTAQPRSTTMEEPKWWGTRARPSRSSRGARARRVEDKDAPQCRGCKADFTLINRRVSCRGCAPCGVLTRLQQHHCRAWCVRACCCAQPHAGATDTVHSGDVFCNKCSTKRRKLFRLRIFTPVRVCDACYIREAPPKPIALVEEPPAPAAPGTAKPASPSCEPNVRCARRAGQLQLLRLPAGQRHVRARKHADVQRTDAAPPSVQVQVLRELRICARHEGRGLRKLPHLRHGSGKRRGRAPRV
jgi:hypothetical protein